MSEEKEISDENEASFEIIESTPSSSLSAGQSQTSWETLTTSNFVGKHDRDQQRTFKKNILRSSNGENGKDLALRCMINEHPSTENSEAPGTSYPERPSLSLSQVTDNDVNECVNSQIQVKDELIQSNLLMKQLKTQKMDEKRKADELQIEIGSLREELNTTKQTLELKNDEIKSLKEEKDEIEKKFTKFKEESQNQARELAEMYTRDQYKAIQSQLSETVAQNLQFKDMEENFTAQIQHLNHNLSSISEQLECCKVNLATEKTNNQGLKEQIDVLIYQAEVNEWDSIHEKETLVITDRANSDSMDEIEVLQNNNYLPKDEEYDRVEKHFTRTCHTCYESFSGKHYAEHTSTCQGISL